MPNGSNHLKRCVAIIRFSDNTCTEMTLHEFYTFTEDRYRYLATYMSTLAQAIKILEDRIDNRRDDIIKHYYDGLEIAEIALKYKIAYSDIETLIKSEESILDAIKHSKKPYLKLRFTIDNVFSAKARCWISSHFASILAKQFENSANKMRVNNIQTLLRKKIKPLVPLGESVVKPYKKPKSKIKLNNAIPF